MTRKNRKNNGGEENVVTNVVQEVVAPLMGGKRKSKAKKGSRKLSPALRAWNQKVMAIYREMKKKNPNTRLMDAMKEAKKRS